MSRVVETVITSSPSLRGATRMTQTPIGRRRSAGTRYIALPRSGLVRAWPRHVTVSSTSGGLSAHHDPTTKSGGEDIWRDPSERSRVECVEIFACGQLNAHVAIDVTGCHHGC